MSQTTISIVAILYPREGKTEQVTALLDEHAEHVRANEPGTLKYEIKRSLRRAEDGTEDIVMVEEYKDAKSLKLHGASEQFKAFQQKLAKLDLMRAPTLIKPLSNTGGFSSRL